MNCPRCERATLDERERSGVTIDACPECRGIWLDRGELEKILSRVQREIEDAERGSKSNRDRQMPSRGDERRRDWDDDDDDYRERGGRGGRRRGFLDSLGEMFGD